jgi:hypothetical protein
MEEAGILGERVAGLCVFFVKTLFCMIQNFWLYS